MAAVEQSNAWLAALAGHPSGRPAQPPATFRQALLDAFVGRLRPTVKVAPPASLPTRLHRPILVGVDLAGADLAGVNYTRANLTDANLAGSDLTDTNLTRATMIRTNLTGAALAGATL